MKTCSVTDRVQTTFRGGGRTVHDVQVGFKYITERMVAERIAVGCEESGGFGFGEHIPERDAILSALMLLEMLARSGHPRLSSLVQAKEKEFGRVFYDRIDLPYHADDRTDLLPRLAQEIPQRIGAWRVGETRSFLSSRGVINGLKFILDGECRWVLLRVSETEPMVRLYAEGNSDEEVRSLLEESRDLFSRPRQ